MTSLTSNTSTINTNAMLSMSSADSANKKVATSENFISYSFLPKNSSRRSTAKMFSIDWDLNMNELEFE